MKKFIWAAGVVLLSLIIYVGGIWAEGIKEGQWSMTITTKMGGMDGEMAAAMKDMENMSPEEKAMMQQMMGGMKMNAEGADMTTTISQCVSNENPVPMATEKGCQETHTLNGNTVQFEMTCPDSHSTGEVTYMGDSMKGTIKSHQTVDGKPTDATIEISGEYTGPCS